jgi:hypothetical protein
MVLPRIPGPSANETCSRQLTLASEGLGRAPSCTDRLALSARSASTCVKWERGWPRDIAPRNRPPEAAIIGGAPPRGRLLKKRKALGICVAQPTPFAARLSLP